jgi:hypothetical protein
MTTGIFRNEIRTIRCTCGTRHRTWSAIGKCALRKIARYPLHHTLRGQDGPYALLACKDRQGRSRHVRATPFSLWPTYDAAVEAARRIDACGGFCRDDHEIVRLARGDDR